MRNSRNAGILGVFIAVVTLTTGVLPFSSPVGVAAWTLAAAALFNPLRRRGQHLVDRRFNRARYDAEATVAAFTLRLRGAGGLGAGGARRGRGRGRGRRLRERAAVEPRPARRHGATARLHRALGTPTADGLV